VKGVASNYLIERVRPGEHLRVYPHPSKHFGLPADASAPIIMVGPGTGIAPFRAFLHERKAAGATGKNWLFFGAQKESTDFLYRDELELLINDGVLTKLSTAFSRDQEAKIYVQHRMLEQAAELWQWLSNGAHVYVCGDAQRMAGDVDRALKQIVAQQGGLNERDAAEYVSQMSKNGRYQRDVY
jgi:sulfite reductase (NADPH) flavoprotein alpha-component